MWKGPEYVRPEIQVSTGSATFLCDSMWIFLACGPGRKNAERFDGEPMT